ncbi:MAG: hypothetical protein R3F34_18815 [Planctomycetota bacterium]
MTSPTPPGTRSVDRSRAGWFACSILALAPSCRQVARDMTGDVAYASGGRVVLLDVDSGRERVLVEDNGYDRPLVWLPDGRRLVHWNHAGGAWDLWSIDVESGEHVNLTRSADDSRSAVGSPDGRWIAWMKGGAGTWVMRSDGTGGHAVHDLGHRDAPPAWSPSSQRLVLTHLEDGSMSLHLVELADGTVTATKELGRGEAVAFVDESRLLVLAYLGDTYDLVIVDVDSGEREPVTRNEAFEGAVALSPARDRIAFVESDDSGSRLVALELGNDETRVLAEVEGTYSPPSFSSDGEFLVYESGPRGEMRVHAVRFDGGAVPIELTSAGATTPVWRPAAR